MIKKDTCFNCGSSDVTGFAGKQEFPLCTACWQKLLTKELTLESLERKLNEQKR